MQALEGPLGSQRDTQAGRVRASCRAAEHDGLARHDAGYRVSGVHRDGVHHPGHRLSVGAHVGRRDVGGGSDHALQLAGEAPRDGLELALAERRRIDRHAALRATKRHVHQRALPGHPHRQGAHLIEVRCGVEADATLGRAAGEVVLDAVAGEDLDVAVVHLHWEAHRELTLWDAKDRARLRVEFQVVGDTIKLNQRRIQRGRGVVSHNALLALRQVSWEAHSLGFRNGYRDRARPGSSVHRGLAPLRSPWSCMNKP